MPENTYPAIERANALQAELAAAFGAPDIHRFEQLPIIGCCDEHEPDFAWYRAHHWAEMPDAIAAGRLDPFELSSLHDAVYYAFVPGLCLHALRSVIAGYVQNDFSRVGVDDWIEAGLLHGRRPVSASVERHLSFAEYRCIATVLYFYDDCLTEIEGYAQTVEAPGGRCPVRELIEKQWDDASLFRRERALARA